MLLMLALLLPDTKAILTNALCLAGDFGLPHTLAQVGIQACEYRYMTLE